jgi:hypothetical protein
VGNNGWADTLSANQSSELLSDRRRVGESSP